MLKKKKRAKTWPDTKVPLKEKLFSIQRFRRRRAKNKIQKRIGGQVRLQREGWYGSLDRKKSKNKGTRILYIKQVQEMQ